MSGTVILAVEDQLGEVVARRILDRHGVGVAQTLGFQGFGYLKRKAPSLNQTALGFPVVLLTDLDSTRRCPAELFASWVGAPRSPSFLFRVAVMEIESWIVADREAFAGFAKVSAGRLPSNADSIADPKRFVVNLFRDCKDKALRRDMVPEVGSTAVVGPAYNARMSGFVSSSWDPESAANRSWSLRRALAAVEKLREAMR
ncbi:MAG: hypothetical protein JW751_02450 [Polyangiaceae bacterium]|nr:hypothetical protein [Polyangiaceae bacterium]